MGRWQRLPWPSAKRVAQLLDELAGGDRHIKMEFRPRRANGGE